MMMGGGGVNSVGDVILAGSGALSRAPTIAIRGRCGARTGWITAIDAETPGDGNLHWNRVDRKRDWGITKERESLVVARNRVSDRIDKESTAMDLETTQVSTGTRRQRGAAFLHLPTTTPTMGP